MRYNPVICKHNLKIVTHLINTALDNHVTCYCNILDIFVKPNNAKY